jgi:uncharacterized protein (DUF433 family)
MPWKERITVDPSILSGKPIIRGTRISVELILQRLSEGSSIDDMIAAWPHLCVEDIRAALAYSADVVSKEELLFV